MQFYETLFLYSKVLSNKSHLSLHIHLKFCAIVSLHLQVCEVFFVYISSWNLTRVDG
jgi:hypothetical protein